MKTTDDSMILNCRNGSVDLSTGQFTKYPRGHQPERHISVAWRANARCRRFDQWLSWAFAGDSAAIDWFWRALGYTLTGDVSEKCMFVCDGPKGNNGKTLLMQTLRDLFGDAYGGQVSESIFNHGHGRSHTSDLAEMMGRRFVAVSEICGGHITESALKAITAPLIIGHRKYEAPLEFRSTAKLWVDCNQRLVISGSNGALMARVRIIPFTVSIESEKIDRDLYAKFQAELPGILASAVRGCLGWRARGLGEFPVRVAAA